MSKEKNHGSKRVVSRRMTKAVVLSAVLVAILMVHESTSAGSGNLDCKDGRKPVGDLGIAGMSFKGSMKYDTETGEHEWYFQAEPKIRKVDPKGPSVGKLEPGDVIVAIDGLPITTHKAGLRFASIEPGERVELSVRRKGRVVDTAVTARAVCPEDHPMHIESFGMTEPELQLEKLSQALESLSRISELDIEVPEIPEIPEMTELPEIPKFDFRPRAWFGMSLTCDGCTITSSEKDEALKWSFDKPPKVRSVEPGSPADEAGVEPGDVLTHVDGLKIDSDKGGERFSSFEPGDTVTCTVKRGGKKQTVRMVAAARPPREIEPRSVRVVYAPHETDVRALRFTGAVAGAEVEVRGDDSIKVIDDGGKGEIVILTRGAEIRIRPSDKASSGKTPVKKE